MKKYLPFFYLNTKKFKDETDKKKHTTIIIIISLINQYIYCI